MIDVDVVVDVVVAAAFRGAESLRCGKRRRNSFGYDENETVVAVVVVSVVEAVVVVVVDAVIEN